ncbi:MAG: polysaccharide deacetylase family protein [Defluviitaleaceae bacterium]|nr:polysaccharide deacetylase family protein [Defluviitaleaceae bacterium]
MRNVLKLAIGLVAAVCMVTDVSAWPLFPEKAPKTAEVPVIMYHLVTTNPKYIGKHGITPEELEADLKFLKDNGYNTVLIDDLVRFVEKRRPLPDKPIVLTFDDGRFSDHLYLFPLLESMKMKAVLSIIGTETDEYSGSDSLKKPHMGWEQVVELSKSGLLEIQCHSYDLHGHTGSGKRKGESLEAYQARLKADLAKNHALIKKHTGSAPTAFTYPLGIISKGSQEVLQELGIKASFSCYEGMNIVTQGDSNSLFMMKRANRPSGESVKTILRRLEASQN